MKAAVIAITKDGITLGRKTVQNLSRAEFVLLKKDLPAETARLFKKYDALVFIMATGIVVRLIAPLIKDKRTDPAVVVLDEQGKYVISLLSGHIGGANELAKQIAKITGGQAVITTASDVQGKLAVDTLAGMLKCGIEDFTKAKEVTADMVNGGRVGLYAATGLYKIKKKIDGIDHGLEFFDRIEDLAHAGLDGAILVTPHLPPKRILARLPNAAFLRPRVLAVGVGCNRNTSADEIEELFFETLSEASLSALSVKTLASVEEKRDEKGLLEFARKHGYKIRFISKDRLLKGKTPSGPSEAVFRNMGVYGVCEPAALIAAGAKALAKALIVPKRKSKNATMAVAEAALRL